MKLLCFGDSNTFGYDPRSYFGDPYPDTVCWTGRLAAAGWEVENLGVCGREIPRTPATLAAAARQLSGLCPGDRGVILLSTNDFLMSPAIFAEEVTARMERFLTALADSGVPMGQLLLLSPPPLRPGTWVQAQHQIRESEQLGELLLPLSNRFGTAFADTAHWNIDVLFDGVHFSPAGHAAFAEQLTAALNA